MRRAAIGFGAILGLAAAALAVAPWTYSGDAVRGQLVRQVGDATGLVADLPPHVTFSLLPRPRLKLEDVSIHDKQGSLQISAHELKGDLRLFALAMGRIEVSSITLFQPTIEIDLGRGPAQLYGAIARVSDAPPSSAEAATADSASLALLRLVRADIDVRDPRRGLEARFHDVSANLDWPSPGAPASWTAAGRWRGRQARMVGWLGDPAGLLREGASPLKLKLDSDLLSATLDGALRAGGEWSFQGRADIETPSVRTLARWAGSDVNLPTDLGPAALSGRTLADGAGVTLTDLSLSIGGSDLEGEAGLRFGTRPTLSATLASDALSLGPYLAELPPIADADGTWSARPFADDFGPVDLDLRISAAHAKLGRIELADLGLAVLLEGGRLDVSLPEAKAYGGALRGRLTLDRAGGQETLAAEGAFQAVDAGSILWDADSYDFLSGQATGDFSVEAHGQCTADLVRDLSGAATFNVRHGELVGIDFEQALRRVEKRPLSVASQVHGGRTGFDLLSGSLGFGADHATFRKVALSGPGARVNLSGDAVLGEKELDIKAVAQQAGDDGAPSADGSRLTVKIEGYWDDPRLVLDVDSLVRSSEAAAPLFAPAAATSRVTK